MKFYEDNGESTASGWPSETRSALTFDEQMILDFLLQEKILLVQGTAFNWPEPDHFRVVFLPREDDLAHAIDRFGVFLDKYSQ